MEKCELFFYSSWFWSDHPISYFDSIDKIIPIALPIHLAVTDAEKVFLPQFFFARNLNKANLNKRHSKHHNSIKGNWKNMKDIPVHVFLNNYSLPKLGLNHLKSDWVSLFQGALLSWVSELWLKLTWSVTSFTHPSRLISTTQLRNKQCEYGICWWPAEVHYILNSQRLLINKAECLWFINRYYVLPNPSKIFIIFSATPPAEYN